MNTPTPQVSERFYRFVDTTLVPRIAWLSDNAFISAIRSGLVLALPLVMMGAFAILARSFPLEAYQTFMSRTFGPDWGDFATAVFNGTFGIVAIIVVFSIGPYLTDLHNRRKIILHVNPLITGLVSLSSLLVMVEPSGDFFPLRWIGISGLFVAILTGVGSSYLFLWLSSFRALRINLPGSIDSATMKSFNVLLPAILTVLCFTGLSEFVKMTWNTTVHDGVFALLRSIFGQTGDGLLAGLTYDLALQVLWFFGVHGANVLDPITHDVYRAAMDANVAAFVSGQTPPHLITKSFFDVYVYMGGSGASLCLVLAILLFSRQPANKRVAQISLLPGIFNINEIILFGLPVILNPIMLIPFILTPVVLTLVSWSALQLGLAPDPKVYVDWTTPVFLNGYLSTAPDLMKGLGYSRDALAAICLQGFNLILGTLIYAPFLIVGDKIQESQTKTSFRELLLRSVSTGPVESAGGVLSRPDRAGAFARSLLVDLERAIRTGSNELYLVYQPQVRSGDYRVCGVESLLRWNHPIYGMIAPPITVSLAEESGLIHDLGQRILTEVCKTRRHWMDQGIFDLTIAVNISTRQLTPQLLVQLDETLNRFGLPTRALEIEVTESSALDTESPQSNFLVQLHKRGLRLAIDDFGMGHSSLKYLKQFPVDVIKIDGAITREVETNDMCVDIISSITRLCRARNITSVVEFVENANQVRILRKNGCDVFQGYYFSRPLDGEDCLAYIRNNFASFPTPAPLHV